MHSLNSRPTQADKPGRLAEVTHRCDGHYEYGAVKCEAVRRADGTIDGPTCGEPCSWIMGKSGHGSPPWTNNADGTRRDPTRPDEQVGPTLATLLAVARECKGWSLRELEKRTGVSNAVISQIETGRVKEPSFSTVVRLSDALGLRIDRVAETVRTNRK